MIIYYIYHLPNFVWKNGKIGKIGCSDEPDKRVLDQGYTEYEILEEHTCIYKVSDREMELQKEYGYPVDKIPYWKSIENRKKASIAGGNAMVKRNIESGHMHRMRTKESCSKGGKITGPKLGRKNVESGHLDKIRIIKYTCPHCGKEGVGRAMKRWHFDNCKHKP